MADRSWMPMYWGDYVRESSNSMAFVYVMARRLSDTWAAPCKIGLARDPRRRVSSVATASPFPIQLYASVGPLGRVHAADLERDFHIIRGRDRLHGEWFYMQPDFALYVLVVELDATFSIHNHPEDAIALAHSHVWCADPEVASGYGHGTHQDH